MPGLDVLSSTSRSLFSVISGQRYLTLQNIVRTLGCVWGPTRPAHTSVPDSASWVDFQSPCSIWVSFSYIRSPVHWASSIAL